MRKRPTLLLLLLFPMLLFSQRALLDSLEKSLITIPETKVKVDQLLGMSRASAFVEEIDKMEEYVDAAIELSKKINYQKGIADGYSFKALTQIQRGHWDHSLEWTLKAIDLAKKIKSKDAQAFAEYILGEYHLYYRRDAEAGLPIFNEILKYADQTVSIKHIGNVHKDLASSYFQLGNIEQGIVHYEEAASYFKTLEAGPYIDPELGVESTLTMDRGFMNLGQVLVYLGELYAKSGNIEAAIERTEQSITLYNKYQANGRAAFGLMHLGDIYGQSGNYSKALEAYHKALSQGGPDLNDSYKRQIYLNLGKIFSSLNDLEPALQNFNKGLDLAIGWKDTFDIIDISLNKSQVYLRQGLNSKCEEVLKQASLYGEQFNNLMLKGNIAYSLGQLYFKNNRLNEAKKELWDAEEFYNLTNAPGKQSKVFSQLAFAYLKGEEGDSAKMMVAKALDVARNTSELVVSRDAHFSASEVEKTMGNYKEALAHLEKYSELQNLLFTETAAEKLKTEQVRQNVALFQEQEANANAKAASLASENKLYLLLGSVLLLVLGIISYLFLQIKKVKEKLEYQNQELELLNRNKDHFFSIIAHDLRSPLVAFQGVGSQLKYYLENGDNERLFKLADRLNDTSNRVANLLDNLLKWALAQQGTLAYRPEQIDVEEIVEETVSLFKEAAQTKGIQVSREFDEKAFVFADPDAFRAILRNLVGNAIKFTDQGGKVLIKAQQQEKTISIEVADTGRGMELQNDDSIKRLTNRSTVGTSGEKGTGLGLVLCKELLNLNKGQLKVSSKLGKGSQFKILLPAA